MMTYSLILTTTPTLLVPALLYPDFDTSSFFVRQDVAHGDNLTKNNLFYIEKS